MSMPLFLFWPALISIALFWLTPQSRLWPEGYQNLLHHGPYLLAAILVLLAVPFRQGRIAIAGLICALSYWLMQEYLQHPMSLPEVQKIYILLALLLPINWVALSFCHDQPPFSPMGLMAVTVGASQLFLSYLLIQHEESFTLLLQSGLQVKAFSWAWQPIPLMIITAICIAIIGIKILLQRQRFDIDTLIVVILSSWMLARFEISNISALTTIAIELILFGTLMYNSYRMAFHDELTHLPSRRALISDLKHASRKYCIAMTDVDHFKKFNDTYGHDVGDDVLKLVATKLGQVSGGGKAYRFGGEEFAVVFRGKKAYDCSAHLELLREIIADYELAVRDPDARPENNKEGRQQRGYKSKRVKTTHVTISLGLAQRQPGEGYEEVMKRADQALYKAKEAGRNRLELAD